MSMQNMMSAAQDAQDGDPSDTDPMQIDNIEVGGVDFDSQSMVDKLTGADDEEEEEQAEL